jgi:hypothetical protein
MKLDLNDYYPAANVLCLLRLHREEGDKARAQVVVAVTCLACERALKRNPSDPWVKPTLLGAATPSDGGKRYGQPTVPAYL